MTDYVPIACGLHSEYELLAMHRRQVQLSFSDEKEATQCLQGKVVDVQTRNGAEYLCILLKNGIQKSVRLDRIVEIST
jgi:transcriptional antiterminator Rof (Rho-off)